MGSLLQDRISKALVFAGAALAVSAFFLPVINPDLFWHLSAGRYMFERGEVPRADFLSWTMYGRPWLDFEWLTQLVYYALFLKGGVTALFLFKALLLLLAVFVLLRIIKLHRCGDSASFLLPLFAAALVANSDLRPENFSVLFFALLFWRLEAIRLQTPNGLGLAAPGPALAGRQTRRSLAAELAGTTAFFALWANLHAGWLYGAALTAFYAAGAFFEEALPFIYGRRRNIPVGVWARHLKILAAALAATLINPYGARIYGVIADHQRHMDVLQEYIQEWKPFDITNIYQWPYLALMGLAFGLTLYRLLKSRTVVYEHLIALLFFAYSSSNHARHSPFFSVAAAVCLAAMPEVFSGSRRAMRSVFPLLFKTAAVVLLAFYYRTFIWTQFSGAARFENHSEGLAGFLKENSVRLSGLRMFNYWGWGGYLGFALSPRYRVFVDGRYVFHGFLEEMENSRSSPSVWEAFKRKYGFELMLVERETSRIAVKHRDKSGRGTVNWRPAYLFYLPRKEWAVVYWDMKVVALVKRDAVDAAWLVGAEYKVLRPDDMNHVAAAALEGGIGMDEIRAEARKLPARDGAPESAGKYAAAWLELLEKACKGKRAKCRP